MAKLITLKVKASTLIEVIIAMVIILVVFALAMGIYNNVLRTTSAVKIEQLKALTDHKLQKSVVEGNWKDTDSLLQDSLLLQKKVLPYENAADLQMITVTAFEQGKQVGQSRRIIKKTAHGH